MKRRIIAFLSLATILLSGIVPAQSVQASNTSGIAELPSTFSYDVTLDEIESALNTYIIENKLDIEIGTPEYAEFLLNLSMTNDYPNIDDTQLRYFRAYASVYLADANTQTKNAAKLIENGQKTIGDIRQENLALEELLSKQPQTIQPREAYNVIGAKEYAKKYAIIPDLSYPVYLSDCTNFASHILRAGGFDPNPDWHYNGELYPTGNLTWIQAAGFVQYWSLTRGYLGDVCTTASAVNARATPGDFLVWQNIDTIEWYHTQFVQSKVNVEIYCTQHTSNYYNVRLNSRIDSTTFNSNHIFIVDMTVY